MVNVESQTKLPQFFIFGKIGSRGGTQMKKCLILEHGRYSRQYRAADDSAWRWGSGAPPHALF